MNILGEDLADKIRSLLISNRESFRRQYHTQIPNTYYNDYYSDQFINFRRDLSSNLIVTLEIREAKTDR